MRERSTPPLAPFLEIKKRGLIDEVFLVLLLFSSVGALVIPSFQLSTRELQEAALRKTLDGMRDAVARYHHQHGHYPAATASKDAENCPPELRGSGESGTLQALRDQLGMYTNAAGEACRMSSEEFRFGPYLHTESMPDNPVSGKNTFVIDATSENPLRADNYSGGWKYRFSSGQLVIDDTRKSLQGERYDRW